MPILLLVAAGPDQIDWTKDSADMVWIPAGAFQMGDSKPEPQQWMASSRPVHQLELDGFYMDSHEVTVGQFKKFVQDSGYNYNRWDELEASGYAPTDEHPMIYVNWHDASAYANWTGKRLPTEAEWEYAARGGLEKSSYPWGDQVSHENANFVGIGGTDQWKYTAPVGSFAANGYGLHDMGGNVYEWCADWYDDKYYQRSPVRNPEGPVQGEFRVLRGGGWNHGPDKLRLAGRHYSQPHSSPFFDGGGYAFGFRCVISSPSASQFVVKETDQQEDKEKADEEESPTEVEKEKEPLPVEVDDEEKEDVDDQADLPTEEEKADEKKPVLTGDVNGDNTVNIFDLVIAAGSFGKMGAGIMGDVNGDESVNIFDLVIVAGNFGKSLAAAPAMISKIELTTEQKHHIASAIAQLKSNSNRSSAEKMTLNVLQSILPEKLPTRTQLLANYPNPFNPETWFPFQLGQDSQVTAKIYDVTGQQIRMIELGRLAAGNYVESNRAIYWDGKTNTGEFVSSGTYFYQIQAGDYTQTRKMVILK